MKNSVKTIKVLFGVGFLLFAGVLVSQAATYQIIAQVPIPSNASAAVEVNETLNKIYVSGGASGGQQTAVIDRA